jgi:hypothetical protein
VGFAQAQFCVSETCDYDAAAAASAHSGSVMRKFVTALVRILIAATIALSAVVPVTAQAHRRHHRIWHRAWHVGPSYYPLYGFVDDNPYGIATVSDRSSPAYTFQLTRRFSPA